MFLQYLFFSAVLLISWSWTDRNVCVVCVLPGKGDVWKAVPVMNSSSDQTGLTDRQIYCIQCVCVCFIPGECQELKETEQQSETDIAPLQRRRIRDIKFKNLTKRDPINETCVCVSHPESSKHRQHQKDLQRDTQEFTVYYIRSCLDVYFPSFILCNFLLLLHYI